VLTALTYGGSPLPGEGAVEDLEAVTLRWPVNGFEFEFVALSYVRPDKNQYAYRLEGFEQGWNQIGAKRYGRYTNLPGGDYTLRLKASNNDGVWNESGASVKIKVVPPLWESGWFQGGLALLAVGLSAWGYRFRVRSVQAHSRALERQVADRTVQLLTMNRLLESEINERKRVEAELAQQAAESAVAAERSRLARDLHDAVTQTLFSASLIAEALPAFWKSDPVGACALLDELRQLNRGALAEMRSLLMELRPAALVEASLDDLLRQLAEAAIGREGLPIEVDVEGQGALPGDVHIALYRITQEALNNVLKHARASAVSIELKYHCAASDGCLGVELGIRDNGRGFDPRQLSADHMGLVIMRERAQSVGATLEIDSRPGAGTHVRVRWSRNEHKEAENGS
jgi:signal transduction histidine kinase